MSYPVGGAPDGSWVLGTIGQGQALNEAGVKSIIRGQALSPWSGAQSTFHENVASTAGLFREVVRLDNRIDEFVIGSELVRIYTYSTNDTWVPPVGLKKVTADVIASSSGGGRSNQGGVGGGFRAGVGGWSGGWSKKTFLPAELPASVAIIVGGPGAGASTDGGNGSAGGDSRFGDLLVATAATPTQYGNGTQAFRIRGGTGGATGASGNPTASYGGDGSFHPGGEGARPDGSGNPGVNGYSCEPGQIGFGSGGGGGAYRAFSGNGGKGGDGGWPGGPGGGGGAYESFGVAGNGGVGSGGAVILTAYIEDTAGLPPTAPTGVAVSNKTATSARVTWTASVDDIAVARYVITVNGTEAGRTTGISYDLTGLTASTSYSVTVHAVDLGANASELSPLVSFTTTA